MAFDPSTAKLVFDPSTARPVGSKESALSSMNTNPLDGMAQPDKDFIGSVMEQQDIDTERSRAFYELNDGVEYSDEMLNARIQEDYGSNATPQVANQYNSKPLSYGKKFMAGMRQVSTSAFSGMLGLDLFLRDKMRDPLRRVMSPEQAERYDKTTAFVKQWQSATQEIGREDYNLWVENIDPKVRESFAGEVAEGLGQLPLIAMYMSPVGAGTATVANFGRMFEEGEQSALAAGKSEEEARNIGATTMVINGTIESIMDAVTAGLGKGAIKGGKAGVKEIMKRMGLTVAKGQALALGEGGTEAMQSAVTQKLASGEVDGAQAFKEALMGYIVSTFAGAGTGTINLAQGAQQTKALKEAGLTDAQAKDYKFKLSQEGADIEALSEEIADLAAQNIGKNVNRVLNPMNDIEIAVSTQAYTLGEANVVRNTMSDQEIRGVVADMDIENKDVALEAFLNPTEASVQAMNDGIFAKHEEVFQQSLADAGLAQTEEGEIEKDAVEPAVAEPEVPMVEFVNKGVPYKARATYIRFGALPDGVSGKYLDGERFGDEPGQSVYLAYKNPKTGKYIVMPTATEETDLGEYIATADDIAEGRKIYEVSGETMKEVGSDGEPLLRAGTSRVVSEISPSDVAFEGNLKENVFGEEMDVPASYDKESSIIDIPSGIEMPELEIRNMDGRLVVWDIKKDWQVSNVLGNIELAQKTLEREVFAQIQSEKRRLEKQATAEPAVAEEEVVFGTKPPPIPEADVVTEPEQESDVVGISRKWNDQWRQMMDEQQIEGPIRKKQEQALKDAKAKGLNENVDTLMDVNRPLTDEEVAAFLIRKTEITNQIDALKEQLKTETDDDARAQISKAIQERIEYGVKMTNVVSKRATKTAQGLAAMNMALDKRTFDLVEVTALAEATKGEKLTEQESESLTEKVDELDAVNKEIEQIEGDEEIDERDLIIDEVERAHRRLKKKGRKKADKNADVKLIRKRQDKIFALIEEINQGKPKSEQIEKVEQPDSEGYLDMINNLKEELRIKKEMDAQVRRNEALIDKRDAILAEIENMHRDIKERADALEKSKLEQDIEKYRAARADQDTIAKLLGELRGEVEAKDTVTKEDVYGYKQTIKELRKQIADKKIATKLKAEIDSLESAVESGEFGKEKPRVTKKRTSKEVEALKQRKAELQKQLREMKQDRDRLDREEAEAIELIDELENVHRRIKTKAEKGQDVNADLKLAKRRQDQIFAVIDEINRGKPKVDTVEKVAEPDSEGYLEMLTNLREELVEVRKERRLDEQIAQMEADLEAGDLDKYKKETVLQFEEGPLSEKKARKLALQREINRQIAAMKPKSMADWGWEAYDVFRNLALTADVGHLMRQGGIIMSNPSLWKSGDAQQFFRESFRALSKENADVIDAHIREVPNFDKWMQAGLRIIEEGDQLDAREEILMDGLLTNVPVIGEAQRAFGRSQITGVNLLRIIAAESYLGGQDASIEEMRQIATAVNVLTGYGEYKGGAGAFDKALNKILISPRFSVSRFQAPFLLAMEKNGQRLWSNKVLRDRVLQDYAWFIGSRMALMYVASLALPDVEIGDDPEDWKYGRLIVNLGGGKKRVYDPWAGVASAYGAVTRGVGRKESFGKMFGRIVEGRQHPAMTAVSEIYTGESIYDGEIRRGEAIVKALLPISVEGALEAIEEDTGILDLITSVATDAIGIPSVLIED